MKTITWKCCINEGKIASLETGQGWAPDDVESELTIIGLLENLKQKHLNKLTSLYSKTIRKGKEEKEEL